MQERTYGYDDAGRINRIQDKRHGERRYHYDVLDQLTRTDIRHPDQDKAETQIHTVDAAGNQLPDGLDHLLDNRLPFHGDRHFEYDEHGNLIRIRRGTGQKLEQRLSYNAKHQLIRIEDYKDGDLQQRLTFRYDALGRRIDKAVQGWVTPDARQDGKTDEAEFKLRYREAYIWQGHTLIQVRHIGTDFMPKNNRVYFYEPGTHVPVALWDQKLGLHQIDTDHAGTPKAMYRHDTAEEVWSTDHETYGQTKHAEAQLIHPVTEQPFEPGLRQQGQYEDGEIGLYQNLHRFYDPNTARYINQDPIGLLGGLNVYQYCPNPIGFIDPLGLSSKECDDDRDDAVRKSPNSPIGILKDGNLDFNQLMDWANRSGLENTWNNDPDKFPSGGFRFKWDDGTHEYQIHGHGPNPVAFNRWPDSNAAQGPTASMTRKPLDAGRSRQENLLSDGTWTRSRRMSSDQKNMAHIPLVNSPY